MLQIFFYKRILIIHSQFDDSIAKRMGIQERVKDLHTYTTCEEEGASMY